MKSASRAIMIVILAGTVAASAGEIPAGPDTRDLPTVVPLDQRLSHEIQKMLDAGHLRPAYMNGHEKYHRFLGRSRSEGQGGFASYGMEDYWSNPAETIYTLIKALPHVPEAMRPKLRAYIQNEWEHFPTWRYTHCGWGGAPREIYDLPPEALQEYTTRRSNRTEPGDYDKNWRGFRFNPFNIYACWLYAGEFGGAEHILEQLSGKVEALPPDEFLMTRPHLLNRFIAGYYGWLGLEQLAGKPRSKQVEARLDTALQKRIRLLDTSADELRGFEFGGFLYLVPELGDYLHQHAREKVRAIVDRHNDYCAPYWFVARQDDVDRLVGGLDVSQNHIREEGTVSLYYSYSSLFLAKALALKQGRAELEKYLDVPAVWRGDLFYIQNLVYTLEAPAADPGRNP